MAKAAKGMKLKTEAVGSESSDSDSDSDDDDTKKAVKEQIDKVMTRLMNISRWRTMKRKRLRKLKESCSEDSKKTWVKKRQAWLKEESKMRNKLNSS